MSWSQWSDWAVLVDDDFVQGLFELVEDLSYDVNDPYHYPVIRVLVSTFALPSVTGADKVACAQRTIHDIRA